MVTRPTEVHVVCNFTIASTFVTYVVSVPLFGKDLVR